MSSRISLLGVGIVLLLLASIIPAAAVPLENVSLKIYDSGGNLLSCPQNNTPVNMELTFEINTASPLPMTYQIRLSPQVFSGSYFDFSNALISKITRDDLSDPNPAIDVTSNATVLTPGSLQCPGSVDFCILINEGNLQMPGHQKWVVKITNVTTPALVENYTISIGVLNQAGSVQYGEYTVTLRVCAAPVIVVPPKPKVVPCSCYVTMGGIDCGCTYRYFKDEDRWIKATPSACFKEVAPYKEGLEFLGWKKYVNGRLVDYINVSKATIVPNTNGRCIITVNDIDTVSIDNFSYGTLGWSKDYQWGYGEPLKLLEICPRNQVNLNKVWGLGIVNEYVDGNYSASPTYGNLTKEFSFDCRYNGTVAVTFVYAGYLEEGDKVIVQAWNGTNWVDIYTLTSYDNTCSPRAVATSFNMNTSQPWSGTKIRFQFVSDGDGNTSAGIYIYYVSIYADTNCPSCGQYEPLYYVSPCECLEDYITPLMNGTVNVTVEAIYSDPSTNTVQLNTSSLTIVFDNIGPKIESSGNDTSYYYFTVTDILSGVEPNSDEEPIKVVAGEDRYSFEHWEKDLPWNDYYTYHVYDPANEVKSAAIFFDRIELGLGEGIEVYGGCVDCLIYNADIVYSEDLGKYICEEARYSSWYGQLFSRPTCTHSTWVRVPLQACEELCSKPEYGCTGCYPQTGCENCAFILYYDSGNSVEWGIHVDSIVYGTGIKVFLDGNDITNMVTITPVGNNATIAVPKSLVTGTSQLVIYATDKVGNANKFATTLSVSGGGAGPSEEPWKNYDSDNDNAISDSELITAIMDWLNNSISDDALLNVIMKWLGMI